MKVIRPGDPEKQRAIKMFRCENCGCEFEADRTEYKTASDYRNGHYCICPCPTCGKDVIHYPDEPVPRRIY